MMGTSFRPPGGDAEAGRGDRITQLSEELADFADFVDNASLGFSCISPEGVIVWANKADFEPLGYTAEEYIGQPLGAFYVNPDVCEEWLARSARGEPVRAFEAQLKGKDGSIRTVLIDARARWDGGKLIRTQCCTRDITERKEAEAALRESEERFRAVLDNSTAVIYVKDCEGRYLLVNQRYASVCHTTPKAFVGQTDFDQFPEEVARNFRENDLAVIHHGKAMEVEEVAPHDDGPHTYISIKFPLRRSDGRIYAVAGISTDITERKRAELADRLLGAIVESSDDAIVSKNLQGIIQTWNKGAEIMFGYRPDEVIGRSITILMPPERTDEEPGILQRIAKGERIEHYETVRRRKDGTLFDVSLSVSPILNQRGEVIGASKIVRDITEHKRAAEQLELAVQERTASLREAIGQMEEFSYTVSHDLRAPLRAMQGYADALLQDFAAALPDQARRFLNRIAANATRLDKMILDVLTFSRIARTELSLERVPLDKLVHRIVEQYPGLQDPEIEIRPLHDVLGHEPSLTQAISNLLNNAVKFVAPGVRPKVTVWSESSAGRVRLRVADNGIGIDPKYHHRLFNMFERIHPELKYEGTGVGLAIVRKAVERMGGKVGIDSDGHNGSCFWLELCAVDAK